MANAGPSPAINVTVSDPLPAGVSFVSVTPTPACAASAGTVTCTFASLASGAAQSVTITGAVAADLEAGTRLGNDASVTSATLDPTTSNNTGSTASTVATEADLVTTKQLLTPTPPLAPGEELTFEITVSNSGPSVARSVTAIDRLDVAGVISDITGDVTLADCQVGAADAVCALGDLDPGVSHTFQVHFVPDPGAALGAYTNALTASTSTPDPDLASNTAIAPFALAEARADLTIAKAGLGPFQAGGPFLYVIDVVNIGPSNATSVVLADTLPAGLVPAVATSGKGSCTIVGQSVSCDLATLSPNESIQVFISGTVAPNLLPGPVANTATISSAAADPVPASNSSTDTSTIVREADLSVSKTPATDPLIAGGVAAYTITVTNAGPASADNVVITDVLPSSIVFDPATSDPACLPGATGIECNLGTVGPGETRAIVVAGHLDPAFNGASVDNTVSVTTDTDDPDPTDNQVTITTPAVQQADLEVLKLADSSTPAAGNELTYTITVTNHGPSDAVNVQFVDELPLPPVSAELPGQGDVTCAFAGLQLTCTAPSLPAGESRTGQITISLPNSQAQGDFPNTATVDADTADPDLANNTSTATVQVVHEADLAIVKTLVTDPIVPGRPVVYALEITNNGPSSATGLLISDSLSDGTTFDSGGSHAGCQATEAEDVTVVGCAIGDLGVGSSVRALIAVIPDPGFTGPLSNTAQIGAEALDPNTANNESTAVGESEPTADLALTKSGPQTIIPGGTATYDLTVTNNGPAAATNVTIADELPTGLTPGSLPDGCTTAGTTVSCVVGTLANGAQRTVSIPVVIAADLADGTTVTNGATVRSDVADDAPQNDARQHVRGRSRQPAAAGGSRRPSLGGPRRGRRD